MKVLGKFMGGNTNSRNIAVGGYVAFNAEWINVETYTGASVEEDKRCFLVLGTAYWVVNIKKNNGDYINPELANSLIKNLAIKEVLDLDEYNMGIFDIKDIRPDSIYIENAVDEEFHTIPLQVIGV